MIFRILHICMKPCLFLVWSVCSHTRLKDQQRAVWKLTELSQHSTNGGVGSLRGKFEVAAGPSTPATVSTQFNCEGTTVSGLEFNLLGSGYRVSLVKKRFVSGKATGFHVLTDHFQREKYLMLQENQSHNSSVLRIDCPTPSIITKT